MAKEKRKRTGKMEIWLKALQSVLDSRQIIFLSDEDLRLLVNNYIKKNGDPRCTISEKTFRNWKAGKYALDEEMGKDFMETLQLAYINQKEMVGMEMLSCDSKDKGDWRRYSFILERRFKSDFGQTSTLELNSKKETIRCGFPRSSTSSNW